MCGSLCSSGYLFVNVRGKFICNHPVYDRCTLFRIGGPAVIQQCFDERLKVTFWCEIDPCLTDVIYLNPGFVACFNEYAGEMINGFYPTITVRQSGAISENKLSQIIQNADMASLRQRATPRTKTKLSQAKINKMAAMDASGYTMSEIADAIGVTATTVRNYLNGKE